MEEKLLRRIKKNRWFAGICAGLGKHFGIDPIVWRLIFIIGTLFTVFPFVLTYIILWIVIPKEEIND